jgi:hypothetical protein
MSVVVLYMSATCPLHVRYDVCTMSLCCLFVVGLLLVCCLYDVCAMSVRCSFVMSATCPYMSVHVRTMSVRCPYDVRATKLSANSTPHYRYAPAATPHFASTKALSEVHTSLGLSERYSHLPGYLGASDLTCICSQYSSESFSTAISSAVGLKVV